MEIFSEGIEKLSWNKYFSFEKTHSKYAKLNFSPLLIVIQINYREIYSILIFKKKFMKLIKNKKFRFERQF